MVELPDGFGIARTSYTDNAAASKRLVGTSRWHFYLSMGLTTAADLKAESRETSLAWFRIASEVRRSLSFHCGIAFVGIRIEFWIRFGAVCDMKAEALFDEPEEMRSPFRRIPA